MTEPKPVLTRRDALKTLAAMTGAIALSNLPNKWEKPVVAVGALPAHAAASVGTGNIMVELTGGGRVDVTINGEPHTLITNSPSYTWTNLPVGPYTVGFSTFVGANGGTCSRSYITAVLTGETTEITIRVCG